MDGYSYTDWPLACDMKMITRINLKFSNLISIINIEYKFKQQKEFMLVDISHSYDHDTILGTRYVQQ